ncbi:MAG: polysaccharide biosynthesis/export family protein [Bryobacteraceae bacterium]
MKRSVIAFAMAATFHSGVMSGQQAGAVDVGGGSSANSSIGAEDQLLIAAADVPGVSDKPMRIESDGTVTLPLVGRMRAEGLTVEQFSNQLTAELRAYVRSPRVSVKLIPKIENRFAVAAGFNNPGVHPLPEQRQLMNVIATVGGLQANAGSTIKIIRRLDMGPIPLPSAVEDPTSNVSTATVNLNRLVETPGTLESLVVKPNDVLSVEPARTVFLTGEVLKPGAFELSDRESIGLAELVSLGGGFGREAAPDKARILRQILNGSKRAEIPVNAASILAGKAVDFPVQANDIVEIPRSRSKANGAKTVLRYVVPAAASAVIYVLIRR